jgi:hypothetical protein
MSRQTELGKLLSELERVLSKQKKVYSPEESLRYRDRGNAG